MMRDLFLVFALSTVVAAGSATATASGAETSTEAETRSVELVQLGIGLGGHDVEVLVPFGGGAEITDHARSKKYRFEVSALQSQGFRNQSGRRQVSVLILETPADRGEASLLGVLVLAEAEPPATMPQSSLRVRLEKVVQLEVSTPLSGESQSFDINDCCIGCRGYTTCGPCVTTACGSCCGG